VQRRRPLWRRISIHLIWRPWACGRAGLRRLPRHYALEVWPGLLFRTSLLFTIVLIASLAGSLHSACKSWLSIPRSSSPCVTLSSSTSASECARNFGADDNFVRIYGPISCKSVERRVVVRYQISDPTTAVQESKKLDFRALTPSSPSN